MWGSDGGIVADRYRLHRLLLRTLAHGPLDRRALLHHPSYPLRDLAAALRELVQWRCVYYDGRRYVQTGMELPPRTESLFR